MLQECSECTGSRGAPDEGTGNWHVDHRPPSRRSSARLTRGVGPDARSTDRGRCQCRPQAVSALCLRGVTDRSEPPLEIPEPPKAGMGD
jgi:hypothetical protein